MAKQGASGVVVGEARVDVTANVAPLVAGLDQAKNATEQAGASMNDSMLKAAGGIREATHGLHRLERAIRITIHSIYGIAGVFFLALEPLKLLYEWGEKFNEKMRDSKEEIEKINKAIETGEKVRRSLAGGRTELTPFERDRNAMYEAHDAQMRLINGEERRGTLSHAGAEARVKAAEEELAAGMRLLNARKEDEENDKMRRSERAAFAQQEIDDKKKESKRLKEAQESAKELDKRMLREMSDAQEESFREAETLMESIARRDRDRLETLREMRDLYKEIASMQVGPFPAGSVSLGDMSQVVRQLQLISQSQTREVSP